MIMRPDLFEQHTVHFPANQPERLPSFLDGVPDASLAITHRGRFTYYYLAPDAGTYVLALPHHAARSSADWGG